MLHDGGVRDQNRVDQNRAWLETLLNQNKWNIDQHICFCIENLDDIFLAADWLLDGFVGFDWLVGCFAGC